MLYLLFDALQQSTQLFSMCQLTGGTFFIFPPWYKHLEGTTEGNGCVPAIHNATDFWLIGAAIVEMLTRLGGVLAVGFFIFGAFRMITSEGSPDKVAEARKTMIYAAIGLVVTILASSTVAYVAGRF